MEKGLKKPVPIPNQDTQPFWEGCTRGQLLLQKCLDCSASRHPPSPICHKCLSSRFEWIPSSGRGAVYSFSIVHHAFKSEWQGEVPYVVAIVKLEEGPHILSNIIGIKPEQIRIDMPVVVTFEKVSEGTSLPRFVPLSS